MTLVLAGIMICVELLSWRRKRKYILQRTAVLMLVLCCSVFLAEIATKGVTVAVDAGHNKLRILAEHWSGSNSGITDADNRPEEPTQDSGPASRHRLDLQQSYDITQEHKARVHLTINRDSPSPASASGRLYIRTEAYEVFFDRGWATSIWRNDFVSDADDGSEDGRISILETSENDTGYRLFVRYRASSLPHILTASAIDLPAILRQPNGVIGRPVAVKNTFFSYSATSRCVEWEDVKDGLHASIQATDHECLQIENSELMERMGKLAKDALGDTTGFAATVEELRKYLHAGYEYSLKVENPDNLHPLENFLFKEKKGHCELFATSFALMLRSIGIPARVGVGYCGGEHDTSKDLYTFFSDNAHAWVEVLVGDHTWVIVDPTPPGSPLAPSSPRESSLAIQFDPGEAESLASIIAASPLVTGSKKRERHYLENLDLYAITLTGIILVAAIIVLLVTSLFRPYLSTHRTPGQTSAPPGYLRLFLRHFAKTGHPKRPSQTLLEYIAQLRRMGIITDEYDEMAAYTYRISYEEAPRDHAFEKSTIHQIRHNNTGRIP